MVRMRNLVLPLALIAIGVLVLLANVGILTQGALERLGDLWPLLLIIVGLQLVLNHTLPRAQATVIGLGVSALIVAGAVAYAVLAPASILGTQHAQSSQPVGGLSAATLSLNYGASSVDFGTNAGDRLYKASFDYPGGENPPSIDFDQSNGTVSISENGNFQLFHPFGSSGRHATIDLTPSIPWTIRVSSGASSLRMNVRELPLTNLEISGGASSVDAQLGAPKGTVAIRISGGASNVTLHIPSGAQWSVSVSGGISSLSINGQSSGAFGDITKQSSGYSGATNRFDIQVTGGVSHLDLRTG